MYNVDLSDADVAALQAILAKCRHGRRGYETRTPQIRDPAIERAISRWMSDCTELSELGQLTRVAARDSFSDWAVRHVKEGVKMYSPTAVYPFLRRQIGVKDTMVNGARCFRGIRLK